MKDSKSSGTFWVIPGGGLQMFRATCRKASAKFEMARGAQPVFDPATARYATSDMVTNVAANIGMTIRGDVASSRVFAKGTHAWKQTMSLEEACNHSHLGKSMPRPEAIIAAYAELLDKPIEA